MSISIIVSIKCFHPTPLKSMIGAIIISILAAGVSFFIHRNIYITVGIAIGCFMMFSSYFVMLIPRRICSRLMGVVMKTPFVPFLRKPVLSLYCKITGVNRAEIPKPLSTYGSISAFFNR